MAQLFLYCGANGSKAKQKRQITGLSSTNPDVVAVRLWTRINSKSTTEQASTQLHNSLIKAAVDIENEKRNESISVIFDLALQAHSFKVLPETHLHMGGFSSSHQFCTVKSEFM